MASIILAILAISLTLFTNTHYPYVSGILNIGIDASQMKILIALFAYNVQLVPVQDIVSPDKADSNSISTAELSERSLMVAKFLTLPQVILLISINVFK
jgi:hypothetical protein